MKTDDYDYYVFDFDGTLILSEPFGKLISQKLMEKHGISNYDRSLFEKEIGGLPIPDYMEWLIDKYHLTGITKEQLNEEHLLLYKECLPEIEFVNGALEYLRLLKAKGKKVGIATACGMDIMESALRAKPVLRQYVDEIMTCDTVGKNKPDPTVYIECVERLNGEPSRSVVFEDSVVGLTGARASGMYVVGMITDREHELEKEGLCDEFYSDFLMLNTQ